MEGGNEERREGKRNGKEGGAELEEWDKQEREGQKREGMNFFLSLPLQVAVHAVPYHKDFVLALKKDPSVTNEQLYEDMRAALEPLKASISEINRFYTIKGQHSEDTV